MVGAVRPEFEDVVGGILSEHQRESFYNTMKHVVVNVEVYSDWGDSEGYDCQGGGVFISSKGLVLTLLHMLCVEEDGVKKIAQKVRVITNEGKVLEASILLYDYALGLVVLELRSKAEFSYANICGDELNIGEEIYPIGHPGFLDFSYPVGHISYPCKGYDEVCRSLNKDMVASKALELRAKSALDTSAGDVCHVSNFEHIDGLSNSVSLVVVNNVHGDGLDGASGMPFFNIRGEIVGMYFFLAHDQCFGIHAKTLASFAQRFLVDDTSQKKKKKKSVSRVGECSSR